MLGSDICITHLELGVKR